MINPEAEGLRAAMRLEKINTHTEKLARHKAERALATVSMEIEELRLWFAVMRSRGKDLPVALTIRQLDDWMNEKDPT